MCIRIVKAKEEVSYDMNKPLTDQLKGCKEVVINYEPKDPSLDHFMDEIEKLCKNGVSANVKIQFNHNNHVKGAKVKKEIKQIGKDLDLNEAIKLMALFQRKVDKALEEMSDLCLKR